jgi:MoaA/NifB/PqqE/SkfB family radical SAM enzyme
LNCSYCFRNSGNGRDGGGRRRSDRNHIDLSIVEKVVSADEEFVLYGYGEPLRNPELKKIVEMLDGSITLSTNGVHDVSQITSYVDRIGFSIDSLSEEYLKNTRKGSDIEKILKNLEKVGSRGFIEVVVTEDNLHKLGDIIDFAGSYGIDVFATNVVPPNKLFYEKALFFEPSKKVLEIVGLTNKSGVLDRDFILNVLKDCSTGEGKFLERYREIHRKVREEGFQVNLLSLVYSANRIRTALDAEKVVVELVEKARDLGINFEPPMFFGDALSRECPYEDSFFIRSDGKVSSCMILSQTHEEFVNGHKREVREFVVSDLSHSDYDEVKTSLEKFDETRRDMDNFPWCADCPHVNGCWYIERNEDCYRNNPSCGECLYSTGIAKCLL